MVSINLSRPKSGRGSHTKRRRAFRPASNPLECLERRDVPAVYSLPAGSTAADLVSTIFGLDPDSGPNTIQLAAGSTFTFDTIDNSFFGPNYLPIIASDLTIQGNGSTFQASGAVQARFFVVSGGYVSGGPAAGTLTLQGLTLEGGVAQGGSSTFGGGGAGMGGAIFNMGTLNLSGVTLTDNQARGGASNGNNPEATLHSGYGGGGMGTDAIGDSGGGNMGPDYPNPHGILLGGAGGSGARGGGGGGGFSAPGGAANGDNGGNGGGSSGLGGDGGAYTGATYGGRGGDGGGGAGSSALGGVGGNAFGGGGNKTGGGGVGGGGGGQSGGGGFGGGGGASGITGLGVASTAGNGGFGGGGGGANTAGNAQAGFGGFGGGNGGNFNGGGGAGMGGAVFNLFGNVNVSNSTFTDNTATGGGVGANSGDPNGATPGSGMGGAIFNLDGDVQIVQSTLSGDNAPQGGAEIYSLSYGANPDGQDDDVIVTLTNSILSGNGNVLTSNQQSGTASVVSSGVNLVTSYQSLNGATTTGRRFMTRSPNLGALKDNGGLVPTMALLRGSPAINAGSTAALLATGASTDTDARGSGFRRIINRRIDLGAYEYQPPATATRLLVRRAPDNLRAFDLIVAVRAAGIGANTPTGSVDLMAGDQVIASEPLVAGRAHFRVAIGTFARLRARAWAVFQGQRVGDYALNGSSTRGFKGGI